MKRDLPPGQIYGIMILIPKYGGYDYDKRKGRKALMAQKNIDAYVIPTDDFHGSEDVGEYFRCRAFISGFTGSAGTVIVTKDKAGLWTDGRYFLQGAAQLAGSGIDLYKMGEPGVLTIEEFLLEELKSGSVLTGALWFTLRQAGWKNCWRKKI